MDLVRRQSTAPESTTSVSNESEWKVTASGQRDLLVISEPAECEVIAGKLVDAQGVKTDSTKPEVEETYSTKNSSTPEIVVPR
jgi:hypothetical protein